MKLLQGAPCFLWMVLERASFSALLLWPGKLQSVIVPKDLCLQPSDQALPTGPKWRESDSPGWTCVIFFFGVFHFIHIFGKCFHIWIVELKGMKKGSAMEVSFIEEDSRVKVGSWDWEQNTGTWKFRATQTDVAQLHQSNEIFQKACIIGDCLSWDMFVPLGGYTHLSGVPKQYTVPGIPLGTSGTDRRPIALWDWKRDSGFWPVSLHSLPPPAAQLATWFQTGHNLYASC